ncbi:MAG: Signal recognition particle 54 kDa protein [Methanonatronarchaeales archaeon]|nr:Signal recognition particle 54 kDa protein [Methanonatronarchaeales archaeon]
MEELSRDVQRALLRSDVDVRTVKEVTARIRKRSLEEDPKGVPVREHVLRVVHEELLNLVGEESGMRPEPQTVMLVGLQGSGKTTTAAKLARWFKRKGLSVGLVSTDTWRPGASDQLGQLADEAGVRFYGEGGDAVETARRGLEELDTEVTIIDTAGRHSLEHELIDEMVRLDNAVQPDQKLLVLDASIGKQAKSQAAAFEEAIGISGVIITKLDGTAKGGGALSAVSETGSSVAFTGTGEHLSDLERFEADGFVSRLLGMGDLGKLARRAEETLSEEEVDASKLLSGKLTLNDVYEQLEGVQSLGPLDQVLDMLPVPVELPSDVADVTEKKLEQYRVIMDSMTEYELENPRKMNASRSSRVARGSGTSREEVKELLDYHKTMQRTFKQMRGGGGRNPLKRLPFG